MMQRCKDPLVSSRLSLAAFTSSILHHTSMCMPTTVYMYQRSFVTLFRVCHAYVPLLNLPVTPAACTVGNLGGVISALPTAQTGAKFKHALAAAVSYIAPHRVCDGVCIILPALYATHPTTAVYVRRLPPSYVEVSYIRGWLCTCHTLVIQNSKVQIISTPKSYHTKKRGLGTPVHAPHIMPGTYVYICVRVICNRLHTVCTY